MDSVRVLMPPDCRAAATVYARFFVGWTKLTTSRSRLKLRCSYRVDNASWSM
ncbi:hypothetical protein GCM10009717_39010 [Agromyces allii]|uniref:Uncharacterized protein n=1 Tax=Agromyces allii TaxID=393607 RepID=A0ABP5CWD2_9MICO